jgi:hypothetical protein
MVVARGDGFCEPESALLACCQVTAHLGRFLMSSIDVNARGADGGARDADWSARPRRRRDRHLPAGFSTVDALVPRSPLGRTALYAEIRRGRLVAHRFRNRLVVAESAFRDWLAAEPVLATAAEDTGDE